MPSERVRYDAALQARVTIEQLGELRSVADDLGVALGVVIRSALEHGLEPARREIAASIDSARDATPSAHRR